MDTHVFEDLRRSFTPDLVRTTSTSSAPGYRKPVAARALSCPDVGYSHVPAQIKCPSSKDNKRDSGVGDDINDGYVLPPLGLFSWLALFPPLEMISSLLFSLYTPSSTCHSFSETSIIESDEEDSSYADEFLITPSLEFAKTRLPVPPPLIGIESTSIKEDIPISPIGYKVVASLPRDIKRFCLDNPNLVSLRVIERISTAECLSLLSTCKGLQHLDVVIDKAEPTRGQAIYHNTLRTFRVYAFCSLSQWLLDRLDLSGNPDTVIFWDSCVPYSERNRCARMLRQASSGRL